jgi:N-acyl-phosphatidylethanolamine-hydrolysing phospholipase D
MVLVLILPTLAGGQDLDLGPAPREPDGRFVNPVGPLPRPGLRVGLPFVLRRIRRSVLPRPGAAEQVANDGAFLRQNAGHSAPTVTWIGHATLLVQMNGVSFLTDPIWSPVASPVSWLGPRRLVAPGLSIESLPPIAFILISHNHFDHLDLRTLKQLATRDSRTRFLVPLGNGALLRNQGIGAVEELDWGEQVSVAGLAVHCLPSQHWSRRGVRDMRRALWASWAVIGPERRFFFGGDTGYFAGFRLIGKALGPFDLAALPIGAYLPKAMMRHYHLDPEQALQAMLDLRARRAIGMHFGTFDLSDEPLDEPPRRFRAAAERLAPAPDDVWVLRVGETRRF